jgi:uncharacterized membrane protein
VLALSLLVATYVAVLSWLTLRQHARFATYGFDLGIHDQGIWLLSAFRRPFVTVRGLPYLGHHLNLVSLLFVPAYWLGAGPPLLLVVQTMFLGAGAVPVWLLGRDALGGRGWAALVPAAAYLLHPTLSWMNWWHFHPETLSIAPLLLALWLSAPGRARWGWYAVCVGFVLSTKEDLALAVAALGVLLLIRSRRASVRLAPPSATRTERWWVPGVTTLAAGVGWYGLATQVVMPAFNGGRQPFYIAELFPQWGDSTGSVLGAMLTDPGMVWHLLTSGDRLAYFGRLLAPSGFVALLGLPVLAIAGPQLAANSLSGLATTYDARYHYSVVPMAAVAAAMVAGLGVLRRWHRYALRVGLVAVAVGSVLSHHAWALTPAGDQYRTGVWAGPDGRDATYAKAVSLVPDDAGVAASFFLVPHLTHRARIYEWPNPWVVGNWGFRNRDPVDPRRVDYLVLDLSLDQEAVLLASRRSSEFETVFFEDGVLVARRVRN